ncbi:hypothetical protein [Herbiconiux liangxiaofengii]|uniref:hypothetical protein n=1 Tax=Herbiconiux liangxiaofengii TaxID=3342795 RepID=UPI0035B7DFF8
MPDEIADAFTTLAAALRPDAVEVDETRFLRGDAGAALLRSDRVRRLADTGSFAHGTAVAGASRWDVLVVLRGARPRTPARSLDALQAALVEGVGAGGEPARALASFAPRVENADSVVVERPGTAGLQLRPAYEVAGSAGGQDVDGAALWVADAAHRWVQHLPEARELLLSRVDDGGALRDLIRLLLAWKHTHGVAVSSYYLETVALRQSLQQRSFSLLWDVCWVWERLSSDGLRPLPDLTSPSGVQLVRATASLGRSLEAQFPVERAASSARGAVNAYLDGDSGTARRYLTAVFGAAFPAPEL